MRSRGVGDAAVRCAAALTGALLFALASSGAQAEPDTTTVRQQAAAIDEAIAAEIADGHLAGAVVMTGDADGVRVRVARGLRVTGERAEPMTADTVFDLASLTKPVATAVAILQLAERGMLSLDAPAARYWPAFGAHGKDGITIRQLLAHVSGLPAGVSSSRALRSRMAVLADVVATAPVAPPGTHVRYSDINYVVLGELARPFNDRLHIGAALDVVPMANYVRAMRFDDTGFGWVPPSPNLRDGAALSLYPETGLVEGAAVSVGRGTAMPFGVVGAPWIDAHILIEDLRAMRVDATFSPVRFVPAEGPYRGRLCEGVRIERLPGATRPGEIGLALALALHRRYPAQFRIDAIRASVGSREVADMLEAGRSLDDIERVVDAQEAVFARERAAFLLY